MKGLILAAGKGTRLRPLSYSKPKPLLPVANQSVIMYGIEHLYKIGIKDIGIVISPHEQENFNKYLTLQVRKNITITYIYQEHPKGVGHAIRQAEDFIGEDSFCLLLGDNLIYESLETLKKNFINKNVQSTVLVTEVKQPSDYGIAEIRDGKIVNIEEKPANPKSNLAVIGAYIFTPLIFKAINSISPSERGEYEITDAIQWLINQNYQVNYVKTDKPTSDVGTMERWLEANKWMLQTRGNDNDQEFNENVIRSIIIPPVKLGDNCKIKDSIIGPYVSIGSHTNIEKCSIKNSIILNDCHFKNIPFVISDSIFGESTIFKGCSKSNNMVSGIFADQSSLILPSTLNNVKKKEGGS